MSAHPRDPARVDCQACGVGNQACLDRILAGGRACCLRCANTEMHPAPGPEPAVNPWRVLADLVDSLDWSRLADGTVGEQLAARLYADGWHVARTGTLGPDPIDALYQVAAGGETSALDELVQRAELRWQCSGCGWMNLAEEPVCENCRAGRDVEEE